jgi:hypothetical protein
MVFLAKPFRQCFCHGKCFFNGPFTIRVYQAAGDRRKHASMQKILDVNPLAG